MLQKRNFQEKEKKRKKNHRKESSFKIISLEKSK